MKLARRLICIVLSLVTLASVTGAVDHNDIAISGEIRALAEDDWASSWSSQPTDLPSMKLGLRVFPTARTGVDFGFGLACLSGVDRDSLSGTSASPGGRQIYIEGGLCYKAVETKKSCLGVLARLGFAFQEWWVSSWGDGAGGYMKYKTYNVTMPTVFVGAEPSYFFSKRFSAYSTFGLRVIWIPCSKYIDTSDPRYDWSKSSFPLIERKDCRSAVRSDGIIVGFRYFL